MKRKQTAVSMDVSTPTQQQAKKRGRPKGSKTKEDRDASAAKTPTATTTTTTTSSGGVVSKVRGGDKKVAVVDDKYTQWKALVPVLYDWFANHNLLWPSLSCRYLIQPFSVSCFYFGLPF